MAEVNNEKILEVKNLRVSFRTNTGTVKAVRGINFSLQRGKTLAIVGESGSGKSVTSKAILGILANNKIIEDGQIIYDGKDLLKITEEDFTKIRGMKISMIFQDPLSSLNPIMKVGKQLTEAMYLKAKASRKEASGNIARFNKVFALYDKEKTSSLAKRLKEFTVATTVSDLDDVKDLFSLAIENSIEIQNQGIKAALEIIEEYKQKYFASHESLDLVNAKKELEVVKKVLHKSLFALSMDKDDIIEVFPTSMNFYISSYLDSQKRSASRAELLSKYNAKDVYDLPASIRVKEREVILPLETYYQDMVSLIDNLINHLNSILNDGNRNVAALLKTTLEYYVRMIVESKTVLTQKETKERAIKLLEEVGINEPERRFNQYPFEFSGGMRQRIVIAIALSSNPEILICDEPTTALDVTIQAQILELINRLKKEKNLSIVFITHDLGVVANMADDIAVMYAGKIVEYGSVYDIFYDPRHPYTWALLGSMPDLNTSGRLDAIPGTPPNMLLPPRGDAFAARNKYALEIDYEEQPPFYEISSSHYAATWLCDEDAPDVEAPHIVCERIYNSLKENGENTPKYTLAKNSILNKLGGER